VEALSRPALAAIKPGFERDFTSLLWVLLTGLLLLLDAACQSEKPATYIPTTVARQDAKLRQYRYERSEKTRTMSHRRGNVATAVENGSTLV
jgi:hypothetical protein